MARSFLLPLTTLLLIVLLFVSPPTTKAAVDDTLVVDIDGNPLETNVPYHIISVIFNRGFFNYPIDMYSTCPLLNIGLAANDNQLGRTQTFYPKNSTQKHISLAQELRIVGEPVAPRPPMFCPQPEGWKLTYNQQQHTFVVSFGGDKRSSAFFKMVAVNVGKGVAYKIEVACPKGDETPYCGRQLGYVSENGSMFLAISQMPDLFVFKKGALTQSY